MSYGKIYETTWWGTIVNNIGFGKIYEGISNTIVIAFKSRVLNDGGTFEAQSCVSAELNRVKGI